MDNLSKKEAINQWLASNPGKTERDWLLEERCMEGTQREDMKRLFQWADLHHVSIRVCQTIGSFKDRTRSYGQIRRTNKSDRRALFDRIHNTNQYHPTIYVESDFQIDNSYCYDLDAPLSVFANSTPDLYLNWKAEQMGINPLLAHTNYEIYEAFKPYMGANIPHWTSFISDSPA